MSKSPIPEAMLAPLVNTRWKTDKYRLNIFKIRLENHRPADEEEGFTSHYLNLEYLGVTDEELDAIREVMPSAFLADDDGINQHYLHSLEQFYAETQKAWNEHVERTEALLGTPAGLMHPNSRPVLE